jgi:replication factor C small subunit
MFRFKPLEKKEIYAVIEKIEKEEKIKIDEKAKESLFNISEGDVRKVENILQSSAAISNNITEEIIYSMASVAKPKEVDEVLKLALKNKFIEARNKLMDIMLNYGLSGLDIIKQIQKEILNLDINNEYKMKLMEKCGEIEFRMTEGSDEFIQLEALLSQFTLYGSKK